VNSRAGFALVIVVTASAVSRETSAEQRAAGGRGPREFRLVDDRVGYALQFSRTNRRRDSPMDPSLPYAPAIDASGPYIRLGVGWYEQ
jgi:hypothetical protein